MWIRKDKTLDQDRGTESNWVCMYTVQCGASVDNRCEFEQDRKET